MEPSLYSTNRFLILVAGIALLFVAFCIHAAQREGRSLAGTRRDALIGVGVVAAWLAPSGVLAWFGVLGDFTRQPPPLMILVVVTWIATTVLALSRFGARLAAHGTFAGLVGFQTFRLFLELRLDRLYREGVVPEQMTWHGLNFDIVTGITALLVTVWIYYQPNRTLVWIWNTMGTALLLVIVAISVLSTPGPLRAFPNEPANTFISTWPWVWLPAFLVQAAWFGHLLVYRKLLAEERRRRS